MAIPHKLSQLIQITVIPELTVDLGCYSAGGSSISRMKYRKEKNLGVDVS
jgi:hypothetical protein